MFSEWGGISWNEVGFEFVISFGRTSLFFRQFILSKYPIIKKHNPDLPVLIREATGTPARAFVRFGECHLADTSKGDSNIIYRAWC